MSQTGQFRNRNKVDRPQARLRSSDIIRWSAASGSPDSQISSIDSDQDRIYRTASTLPGWIQPASSMLGGAGVGSLLGGGLSELLEQFTKNGQGEAAESWVGDGPNKEVSPPQLKQAIGQDVLAALVQQTGLSQEELLARLSRELPTAVDKYTPDGRLPSRDT